MRNTLSPFPVTATGKISGLIEPGDRILRTGAADLAPKTHWPD